MSLTNAQRPKEAVPVLWEAHERELTKLFYTSTIRAAENPQISRWQRMTSLLSTRFKLVTAMANSGYCSEAEPLVDEALALIEPQFGDIERFMETEEFSEYGSSGQKAIGSLTDQKTYAQPSFSLPCRPRRLHRP